MKYIWILILIVFNFSLSFSQEQNKGSITGTVIDHELQVPVKDVAVSVIELNQALLTDIAGRF
jgi:hypothetical protein